jgi:hypothetical protein
MLRFIMGKKQKRSYRTSDPKIDRKILRRELEKYLDELKAGTLGPDGVSPSDADFQAQFVNYHSEVLGSLTKLALIREVQIFCVNSFFKFKHYRPNGPQNKSSAGSISSPSPYGGRPILSMVPSGCFAFPMPAGGPSRAL